MTGEATAGLSQRELEVARLLGEGQTVRAIAEALGVSEHTVKTHKERVYRKCGVRSRAELVWWLVENGKNQPNG